MKYPVHPILCAVGLRLAWLLVVPVVPVSDSARYDAFARGLAAGKGYVNAAGPTAYWPVGPSFLYSLGYRITGWESDTRFIPVVIMNLLMGMASVGLTTYVGNKCFSPRIGMLAGLLLALWPSQVQFTTVLNSEIPMMFFMLVALAIWSAERPNIVLRGALAGAFLAAASLMRPTALLLPVVFCIPRLVSRPARLKTIAGTAAMAAAMSALILPWSFRNQRVFGEFVLISTNGGVNFWMGNNPETTGFYQSPPTGSFASEADRDRELRCQALAYIRRDPAAFLKRTIIKATRLHERESIGVVWNQVGLERRLGGLPSPAADRAILATKLLSNVYWWGVLLLALIGVVRLARHWPLLLWLASPPILIWAYFTAVHAVTVVQDRYHFAFVPLVAVLAAVGLLGGGSCLLPAKRSAEQS